MNTRTASGFTLIEIMVAMVVLAVGLLGMAAMTVMVMRGSKTASDLTSATNLCQTKIEELKDVDFEALGNQETNADDALSIQFGDWEGNMVQEAGLNAQGRDLDEAGADEGPFKFTRTFVVCKSSDYTGSDHDHITGTWATPEPDEHKGAPNCRVDPTNASTRVQALWCDGGDIALGYGSDAEKKIKVLCTWTDRTGNCHSVHLDTTVVDLN